MDTLEESGTLEADETTTKDALPILLPLGVRNDSILEHLHHNLTNLPSVSFSDISMSLAAENEASDRVEPSGDDLKISLEEQGGTAMAFSSGVANDVPYGHSKAFIGEIVETIQCPGGIPQTEPSLEQLAPGKSCLKRLTDAGCGFPTGCGDHGVHFPSESQLEECHTYSSADSETSQNTIDIEDIMNLETEDTYVSRSAPPSLRSLIYQCFGDKAGDVSCHSQDSDTSSSCDNLSKYREIGDRCLPENNREDVALLTEGVPNVEERGLEESSGMLEIIGVESMFGSMNGELVKDSIPDRQRLSEDGHRFDTDKKIILGEVERLLQELVGTITIGEHVDSNGCSDEVGVNEGTDMERKDSEDNSLPDKDNSFENRDISVESRNSGFQSEDSAVASNYSCVESDDNDVESKDIQIESKCVDFESKDRHFENKDSDDNNCPHRMDVSVEGKDTDIDSKDGSSMNETIAGPVSRTLTVPTGNEKTNATSLDSNTVISHRSRSVSQVETTPDVVQSSTPRLFQRQDDSHEISYSPLSQGSDAVSLFDSESEDRIVEAELKGQFMIVPSGGDTNKSAVDRSEHVIQTSSHADKEHQNNNLDVNVDSSEVDNRYDHGRSAIDYPDCMPVSQTNAVLSGLKQESVAVQLPSTSDAKCHIVDEDDHEIGDKEVRYPGFIPASQASSILGDLVLSQELGSDQVSGICCGKSKAEDETESLIMKEEGVRIPRDGPSDRAIDARKRLHDLHAEPGDDKDTTDVPPEKRLKNNPRIEVKSNSSQKRQGDRVVTCSPQKVPKVEAHSVVPDQEVPGDDLDVMVEKTLFEDQDKKFYSCDMDILDEKDSPLCQTVNDFVRKPNLHQLESTNSIKADIMRDVPPTAKSVFTWKQSAVHYTTYSESNTGSRNVSTGDCETALAVLPLRTARGPLRLGLSKRQSVRPLHSNVKR